MSRASSRRYARPRRALALPLVALMAAGCLASPESNGPAAPASLPGLGDLQAGVRFGPPLVLGAGGGETSLAIGRDGTILACIHGGFSGPSPSWVSQDDGKTFQRLNPTPNPIRSGDCDLAVTDDGAWAIVYDTLASSSVAVTRDKGQSWTLNHLAALPIGGVDRPWLEADGNDLLLLYQDVAAVEPDLDMFARSTDGGRTWLEHRVVNYGQPPNKIQGVLGDFFWGKDHQSLRAALLRYWMPTAVPTGDYRSPPKYLELATSRDRGVTWEVRPVLGPIQGPLQFPTATEAGDGTLYYSYQLANGTADDVYVIHSADDGRSWSKPVRVASGVWFANTVSTTWIDGRRDGSATLAWLQNEKPNATGKGTSVLYVARVNAQADPFIEFVGPVGEPAEGPQGAEFIMVRHDANDKARILYPMSGTRAGCPGTLCIQFVSEI